MTLALIVLYASALFMMMISPSQALEVQVDTSKLVAMMSPNYIAFGWEMFGMLGILNQGHLTDPRFILAASHLAPATIRVGGITGDWVRYTQIPNQPETYWPTQDTNLSMPMFDTLTNFMAASNLSLLFMLNELYGRDCNTTKPGTNQPDWCTGPWDTSNVQAFLTYLHDTGRVGGASNPLYAFELGNELASHLYSTTVVEDIRTAAGIIQDVWGDHPPSQRPGLYAPSTDDCTSQDQLDIMRNITGIPGVAGFTFHAYPGGDGMGPNSLSTLILNASWLAQGITTASGADKCLEAWNQGPRGAGLELLLTESSSSWNASLLPPAQNSFLHTLFTLAELGQYAASGLGMVARWAFSESTPFALIRHNDSTGGYDVAGDFWLLLARKQALGKARGVLAATAPPIQPPGAAPGVLAYATCGSGGGNGTITIQAINTGGEAVTLSLVGVGGGGGAQIPAAPRWQWVFTAPGGDLGSIHPVLNGGPVPLAINPDGSLPDTFAPEFAASGDLTLPPLSSAIFLILDAQAPACTGAQE